MVVEAVERDLVVIGRRLPELATGALAETARSLAVRLDDPGTSATAAASCAKALVDIMGVLRELAPAEVEGDSVDELVARREARIAG